MQGLDRPMVSSSPTMAKHCEICKDTLCEFCSEEAGRKPHARIQSIIRDPAVSKENDRWAMTLNRRLIASKQNWMLDIYQILDVHAKGKVQWRRNNFSIKVMEK